MSCGLAILSLTAVGWCFVARVSGDVLPVYHQELTTSKYLYQSSLPAMSELTTCFWMKMEDNDDRKDDYFISVASQDHHNEFLIGWDSSGDILLYIQGRTTKLPLPISFDDMSQLFTGWHRHCFTWKAGGQIKWYADIYIGGHMELVASTNALSYTIRAGGFLVLMQDQDSVNGSFALSQTVPGQLAEFNMWNHEMLSEEVRTKTCGCGAKGSVVSWDTLQEQGTSTRSHHEFPDCHGKSMVYHQERTTSKYLYQSGLPAMSQSTTCFWLRMEDGDDRTDDWFFSYVLSNVVHGHEFLFGFGATETLTVYVRGSPTSLSWLGGITVADLFTGWHKHCLTWRAGGQLKWYTDRQVEGQMELVASAVASNRTMRGDGYLVLLQEQDGVYRLFTLSQMVPGQIAEFNMWQHEMTLAELNSGTCGTAGTVSSWSTLEERGTSARSYRVFPACTTDCPSSYSYNPYSRTCLLLVQSSKSWLDSQQHCMNEGGYLATFSDMGSFNWTRDNILVPAGQSYVWVGGMSDSYGTFTWRGILTGGIDNELWIPSYPRADMASVCLEGVKSASYLLRHYACTYQQSFLCEMMP